jgi:hypothetical protein
MRCDLLGGDPVAGGSRPGHGLSRGEGNGSSGVRNALEGAREIDITVTGGTSGRQITLPVWFVQEDHAVYLLPVRGREADWYKNLVKNRMIALDIEGAEHRASVTPVTDAAGVNDIVDRFRAKYGSRDVADYYPSPDVAVEVPIT